MRENRSETSISKEEIEDFERMLKIGLHFGAWVSQTHPRMKPFLYGTRNRFGIFDLQKSKESLKKAIGFLKSQKKEGKTFLILGTKKVVKSLVKNFAKEMGIPYLNERWVGGLLTNFEVIKKRIDFFLELEKKKEREEFKNYPKKERLKLEKTFENLKRKFEGLKSMPKLPDILIVVDPRKEEIAIKEAKKKNIQLVGICGSDSDPSLIDYPIFANVNSKASIDYIFEKIKEAIKNEKNQNEKFK